MKIFLFFMVLSSFFISLDLFGGIILLSWIKRKSFKVPISRWFYLFIYLGIPVLLFLSLVFRHWSFESHAFDMTFVNQSLMHAFSNPILHSDMSINESYLGEHISFSLLIIGVITNYLQSDLLIMLIHNVLLSLSLYFLITKVLSNNSLENRQLSLIAFFLVFCSKALKGAYLFDFREDSVAFAALMFLLYSVWSKKRLLYIMSLLILIMSKENYAIIGLFIPIAIFFDKDLNLNSLQKKFYIWITFLFCSIWMIFCFKILIPHYTFGSVNGHPITMRFKAFGQTPGEILFNIIVKPSNWYKLASDYLLGWDRLKYLIYLFAPFILFIRKSWVWVIPAMPGIFMNLIAPHRQHRTMGFHYDLMTLPFIIFAFLLGMKKLKNSRQLMLGIGVALLFSGKWPSYYLVKYFPTIDDVRDNYFLGRLDSKKITAAGLSTLSHLNHIDELRAIKTPVNDMNEFIKFESMPHGKNSQRPIEASIWVLDNQLSSERKIKELLIAHKAKILLVSPSQRFTVVEFRYNQKL